MNKKHCEGKQMRKIKKINQLRKIIKDINNKGKTVGIITGCFEILHVDYLRLFKFAKKRVDVLVIGMVNDENIRISKGKGRPIFNFSQRAEVLSEVSLVDYIFKIDDVIDFSEDEVIRVYKKLYTLLEPNYIITNKSVDKYLECKRKSIEGLDIKILTKSTKNPIAIRKIIV